MSASLPERMDAERMIAARRSFSGTLPLSSMSRLQAVLADDDGEVEYALDFDTGEFGTRYVAVHAKARLTLECQRTLQPFELSVEVNARLGLISEEREEAGLPPDFEPLLLDHGGMDPRQVIEDELLLALPLVPVKPGAETETGTWNGPGWSVEIDTNAGTDETKPNPFAILRELKKNH